MSARRSGEFRCVPVTASRWRDLATLFGEKGACAGCWCMWPRLSRPEFKASGPAGRRRKLQKAVREGPPPGLLGYVDGEPAAWCALGPRETYSRITTSRTLQPVDRQPVWSVVCFFVGRPYRKSGLSTRMLREAARYARSRGARLLEGYPVEPGSRTPDAFVWTGLASMFRKAGFTEVARPSRTRPIMRKAVRRGARLIEKGAARA